MIIWSSNSTRSVVKPVVQLLESGNLVFKDGLFRDSTSYIWQSFDYPTNTRLPEMKFGWDLKIGLNRYLTSWKNVNDPSIGDYSYGIELPGLLQFVLHYGSVKQFRSGLWNGVQFSGLQNIKSCEHRSNDDIIMSTNNIRIITKA
ncbi:S-locus-specific glycoprotein S6-like [Papaver somniferum]|uniref:S-locus-specific glycoprotein S6-like n=1 Tax=Papaver somniferum TaxID=3469 RepID=UPI000E6FD7F9|nr:S-locus-specific glycoprotein S6-like [Papaver somniferum]